MQLQRIVSSSASFRFRRWSRNGAAAFLSLRYSVQIGRLAKSVLSRIEKKTSSLLSSSPVSMQLVRETERVGDSEDKLDLWTIGQSLWLGMVLGQKCLSRKGYCPYSISTDTSISYLLESFRGQCNCLSSDPIIPIISNHS